MKLENNLRNAETVRLAKLILWIAEQGHELPEEAAAAVNPSSGNVYIWSEDWAATPYITMGGHTAWLYSCPNCGNEEDFDTLDKAETYLQEHDGECEECHEADE